MAELGSSAPTLGGIVRLARAEEGVTVAPEALARVAELAHRADDVAATRPVYGRSTGVGANRDQALEDPEAAARRLIASHATSTGAPRPVERVRALLVVRLEQLLAGGSGIAPAVVTGLADLLTPGEEPVVRDGGSVGTGDLSALATVGLALEARGVTLGPGDALALLSSNAGAVGDAALAVHDLEELSRAALVAAALTFAAVRGNPEAFGPVLESFPGAAWVCTTMRGLVPPVEPARIQDPFGLRTLPQVHGPFRDALGAASTVVERMTNGAFENPLFLDSGVHHQGGFHAAYLSQALDAVVLAAGQSAQLGLARVSMLMSPGITGLAPFLADGTPGASGAMLVEYAAASALGNLRALATPASLQSVTLSRGLEEDASFASLAARQGLDAVSPLRTLVAAELVCAHRALTARPVPLPSSLAPALDLLAGLGADLADRDLTDDLDAAAAVTPDLAGLVTG